MEFNYSKCPECGYINKNQPDVCPSCGCDLKAYREDLQAQEEAFEAAEQARKEAEQARVADLSNRAYSFISETMDGATQGEDENKNYLFSFIAAFFDGSNIGHFASETERSALLLAALYRYYDVNKDEKNDRYYDGQKSAIIDCYNDAIELMGRYLSSSRMNRLKSAIDWLPPYESIKFFFNFIITELEFESLGHSPFKDELRINGIVWTFVERILADPAFSTNEKLKDAVGQYVTLLHNTYEEFSDLTMEDFYIEEDDDYCDDYPTNCPHCDAAIKILRQKIGEECKIKCAACGKTWMNYVDDRCPECGVSGVWDRPYGINSMTCDFCGLKYDLVLTDPDDDEGALASVLDDERAM